MCYDASVVLLRARCVLHVRPECNVDVRPEGNGDVCRSGRCGFMLRVERCSFRRSILHAVCCTQAAQAQAQAQAMARSAQAGQILASQLHNVQMQARTMLCVSL
jgi:hypothetical protein